MKAKLLILAFVFSQFSISQTVDIVSFGTGFTSPVEITHANDSRLFVVEQGGAIKILNANGTVNASNFLTLTSTTLISGGERGLLGLAFHPDYATNGYFYVNYTRAGDGATVIARYSVSTNPNSADSNSGTVLLTIAQPFSNHNGGSIKFGSDGYLYIGMGDGGSAGDPGNRAQNINENLGKMLRIDVNSGVPYGIPPTNPYVGIAGNDAIWAIGLRNPWKFSFNRNNGDLWIADVGQNAIEEINKVPSPLTPGLNFGWRCYEGNTAYNTAGCPAIGTFTMPLAQYTHSSGACSVTGGYVYTGSIYPNFSNQYFFADYCVNRIGMVNNASGAITYSAFLNGLDLITTFGEDNNGELYVASAGSGIIYKIIDSSLGVNTPSKGGFFIYPNPASSEFYIQKTNAPFPAEVQLFDSIGKLVLTRKLESADTGAISTTDLQDGIYLLKIKDVSGAVFSSKLSIKKKL